MSAVVFEDLGFRYPGAVATALHECSFEVRSGTVTWFTGALGAGTSTALLVAAGLAPRHTGGDRTGRVESLGVDPAADLSLGGRIALVLSSPATQLSGIAETVWQEVAFAPANLGWPRPQIEDRVDEALNALDITHLAAQDPATLSGGEMQRVVIAATLVLGPELWLLDEPTSALDASGRSLVHQLLRREAGRGAAVLVASEDADGLLGVADRLMVFEGGTPVIDAAPEEVLRGSGIWEVGAASTAIASLARAAAVGFPAPLTVDEGVARWSR